MPDNQFSRDSSDQLCFEIWKVPSLDYPALCRAVATALSLTPLDETIVIGLDVILQDFQWDEQLVELAWDNWFGFIVTAKTSLSESLVHEIGKWLLQSEWIGVGG